MVRIPLNSAVPRADVGPQKGPASVRQIQAQTTQAAREICEATVLGSLPEIECPLTGELVSVRDVDSLIDLYERCKIAGDRLYAVRQAAQRALHDLCEGDAKTRRVRGRRRQAKVETPSDGWDQSILKEAWNSFPALRDEVLKIDSIGVKLREFKKLVNTAGDDAFTTFRDMVSSANRGPSGTPAVTVEV
jgi:hypothetical protein